MPHEVGGHCVRDANGDACVIFVHGILSNGESAWTNSEGVSWPQLLATESSFSELSIYAFSYRSDLFSRTYSLKDVVDSIREFFNLDHLWDKRCIIFVCHSMGGIAVRRFVVVNQVRLIQKGSQIGLFMLASPSLVQKMQP